MNPALTQLGLGGMFALLIIREVLTFLKSRKSAEAAKVAGEQSSEYWQAEQRRAVSDVVVTVVIPILSAQAKTLDELRASNTEMQKTMAIILDRLTQRA